MMRNDEVFNDDAEVVMGLSENGDERYRCTATDDHDLSPQITETKDVITEIHDDEMPPDVIVKGNEAVWREWWRNTMGKEEEKYTVSVERMWPCMPKKESSRKRKERKRQAGDEGQEGRKKGRSSSLMLE